MKKRKQIESQLYADLLWYLSKPLNDQISEDLSESLYIALNDELYDSFSGEDLREYLWNLNYEKT